MSTILPNFGRPYGAIGPVGVDHNYRDSNETKEITLLVYPSSTGVRKDDHWMIYWEVGMYGRMPVHRRLHLVQETGMLHLTNWGPVTQIAGNATHEAKRYRLGHLTLRQRGTLERIARETQVYAPNGDWNCQNWVFAVIYAADFHAGIINRVQWGWAVSQARIAA
jgi:hypothetical protein